MNCQRGALKGNRGISSRLPAPLPPLLLGGESSLEAQDERKKKEKKMSPKQIAEKVFFSLSSTSVENLTHQSHFGGLDDLEQTIRSVAETIKLLFIPPRLRELTTHGSSSGGGSDMVQDRGSMRFENRCHTSAGRCLMSSNSIAMSSHQEILGWRPAASCLPGVMEGRSQRWPVVCVCVRVCVREIERKKKPRLFLYQQ